MKLDYIENHLVIGTNSYMKLTWKNLLKVEIDSDFIKLKPNDTIVVKQKFSQYGSITNWYGEHFLNLITLYFTLESRFK